MQRCVVKLARLNAFSIEAFHRKGDCLVWDVVIGLDHLTVSRFDRHHQS
jgi:hypothetical protein